MLQQLLHALLLKDRLPKQLSVATSKGIHLSMLVLHLLTSLLDCKPEHDLYPLKEIISKPEEAAVRLPLRTS